MSPTLKTLLLFLPLLLCTSSLARPRDRPADAVPPSMDCKDQDNNPTSCDCKCEKPGWSIQLTMGNTYSLDCHGPQLDKDESYGPIGWRADLAGDTDCVKDRPDYKALDAMSLGPEPPAKPTPAPLTPEQIKDVAAVMMVCKSPEAMEKLDKETADVVGKFCDLDRA
ncbi:MAG: hypothetical protein Q9186_000855 [Xanthomendoza sp. 1 TL-2023]